MEKKERLIASLKEKAEAGDESARVELQTILERDEAEEMRLLELDDDNDGQEKANNTGDVPAVIENNEGQDNSGCCPTCGRPDQPISKDGKVVAPPDLSNIRDGFAGKYVRLILLKKSRKYQLAFTKAGDYVFVRKTGVGVKTIPDDLEDEALEEFAEIRRHLPYRVPPKPKPMEVEPETPSVKQPAESGDLMANMAAMFKQQLEQTLKPLQERLKALEERPSFAKPDPPPSTSATNDPKPPETSTTSTSTSKRTRRGRRNNKRKDSVKSEPEKRKRDESVSDKGPNKAPKRSSSVSSSRSSPSTPSTSSNPSTSSSTSRGRNPVPNWLWEESFEKQVVFSSKHCRRCGLEGHDRKACPAKSVSCKYFFCKWEWEDDKTHDVRVCPNIVKACDHCKVRGHPPGRVCDYSRDRQRSAFESCADDHLYLKWRHSAFSWGHYTLPNRRVAERLAKETSYNKLLEDKTHRDVQVMIKNLSN